MPATIPNDEITELRGRAREAASTGDGPGLVQSLRSLLELTGRPADYAFAANSLRKLGPDAAVAAGLKRLRTYVARSITIEPLQPHLVVQAALAGFWLDMEIGPYGSFMDDLMNADGALCRFDPDLVLFLSDLEDLAGRLGDACTGTEAQANAETDRSAASVSALIEAFRRTSRARIVVQGMVLPDYASLGDVADANLPYGEGRAVHTLNEALAAACRRIGDAVYFDQDRLAARHGRARWRDERLFYSTRLAVAPEFFAEYARGLARTISVLHRPSRKVLCTDLDETLWGGIVGEDGPEGIITGAAFPGNGYLRYQNYLKRLAARGILLALVSKNNEADVKEAFRKRANDVALTLEDFAGVKVGWQEKSTSLAELAQDLSLGLDSFVFVDDSQVECAAVRQRLPEVLVVEACRAEPWRTVAAIEALGAFDMLHVTEDDRKRVSEYRAQAERAALQSSVSSRDEFLASLGIHCEIISALDAPLSRTAQLLAKTNQFNLTTRRHSASHIEGMAGQPGSIAAALRYRDRFGDGGVVGVALCRMEQDRCLIDTFLLSCRVIGRGVETALLSYVMGQAKRQGATQLRGEYIPTAKNALCRDFYALHGFRPTDTHDTGGMFYELDTAQSALPPPSWITMEGDRMEIVANHE